MEHKPLLTHGITFHIYNRSVGKVTLFRDEEDFVRFRNLLKVYLGSVADIYCYILMSNHFHLALRIKEEHEIGFLLPGNASATDPEVKWRVVHPLDHNTRSLVRPIPERMLGHLLNAYAKYYNKKYKRTGRIFEARFERKPMKDEHHLRTLILYIIRNPEHHRVVTDYKEYRWSAFHDLMSEGDTFLERQTVFDLFGGKQEFLCALDKISIDDWLSSDLD